MTSLRIPATLFTLAALAALAALASVASAESPEEAAARVPLELYLKGHATGNGDYWRQAFHEGAKIQGIREGQLVSRNAKIDLDYPKVHFTDYMTLLKVDGEWKIMSKVYQARPK